MSRELKKGEKVEKGSAMAKKVVAVVKASKEIPKTALVWALTHVVQPGDCITLLVVISQTSDLELRAANMRLLEEEEVARLGRELEISSNRRRGKSSNHSS
ncbi:hypothetical protein ACS0TY_032012 [Phlomoides rotata]